MIRLILALCLGVVVLASPVTAQDGAAPPASEVAAEDSALDQRLRGLLDGLEGYDDVRTTTRSGLVILEGEVVDPAASERIEAVIGQIDGVIAVENRIATSTDLDKRLNPAASRLGERLQQAINYLPLLLVAGVAAAVVWALGFYLARRIRFWKRIAPNAFIAGIYRQILRLMFVLAGIVLALDILGATALIGTILGAAGLVGLAIGFAVKDTVENFIASIMLSMRQPFRPNDMVRIEGHEGRVIRLTSRATILLDRDGNHVRIPNATVFKGQIINYTSNPERRLLFQLGVEPDCNLAEIRALMASTLNGLPFVLDKPAVSVWLDTLNEGGAIYTLTAWIDQRDSNIFRARGEALRVCKDAIEAAGASIPDTTYRIRMENTSAARDASGSADPSPGKPIATAADLVDVAEDDDLTLLIEAERADTDRPDLLSKDAQSE